MMLHYSRIPIWTNKHRLTILRDFRQQAIFYFEGVIYSRDGNRTEMPQCAPARQRLNYLLVEVDSIIDATEVGSTIDWTPPPITGGRIQRIHLILNIFNLDYYHIPRQFIGDTLDRAIGVYERDAPAALRRTFNPFYWLGRGLEGIARLPFIFLGRIGFDQRRLEESWLGKLVKGLIQLATLVGAIGKALKEFGLFDPLIHLLKR